MHPHPHTHKQLSKSNIKNKTFIDQTQVLFDQSWQDTKNLFSPMFAPSSSHPSNITWAQKKCFPHPNKTRKTAQTKKQTTPTHQTWDEETFRTPIPTKNKKSFSNKPQQPIAAKNGIVFNNKPAIADKTLIHCSTTTNGWFRRLCFGFG